ncbi:MAG: hypothetical protein ACSLFE_06295 [Gemmatimonadaceae bacterium]
MNSAFHPRRSMITAGLFLLSGGGCGDAKSPIDPIVTQPGRMNVWVVATGGDPDDNGYDVVVGANGFRRPVGVIGISSFDFPAGTHSVLLEGVAPNCTVTSANPLSVALSAGGVAEALFRVECETTGVEVRTRTTGSHFPSNHLLLIDNLPREDIPINGAMVVGRLAPGPHAVTLSVQTQNCTVTSAQSVTVIVANRAVTPVEFEISCRQPLRLESIAYTILSATQPQTFSIGLVRPDGTGAYEVAAGHSPAWAPDGIKLIFSTTECGLDYYYSDFCTGGLMIVDPEMRQFEIPSGGEYGRNPAWSPSGDAIAFTRSSSGETSSLYVLPLGASPGGTAVRIVVPSVLDAQHPAWSPDGQRLAFSCMIEPDNADICVINTDGSGLIRLTSDTDLQMDPAWRPDGGAIAFTIYGAAAPELAVIAATGGAITTITTGSKPAWSRDGAKLVFERGGYLFTSDSDGSNATQLTVQRGNDPAWRP